jgi:hypothetical protein
MHVRVHPNFCSTAAVALCDKSFMQAAVPLYTTVGMQLRGAAVDTSITVAVRTSEERLPGLRHVDAET